MKINWKEKTTINGYPADEVISSLQKDIRRGNEEEAAFWAYELSKSGKSFQRKLWERLITIAVEDIGFGNPQAASIVQSLKQSYFSDFENEDDRDIQAMFAATILARSTKDRYIDEMKNYFKISKIKKVIPEYALDKHTKRGKALGHGSEHFWTIGAKLNPEDPKRNKKYLKEILKHHKIQNSS